MNLLKWYVLFLFQVLWLCVCVFTCTRMCNSPFSLQYFSTQWQPIQIQLKWHRGLRGIIHSTVIHSPPPPSSSSAACGWLGGNGVGELYHFLVLSLCLLLFIPPVVHWHLGVNMFHLAWCQNVYSEKSTRVVLRLDWRSSWNVILDFSLNLTIAFKSST